MKTTPQFAYPLSRAILLLTASAGAITPSTMADTFGIGANTFTMDFVTIGNPGNTADTTGSPNPSGAVGYTYQMGKYEVNGDMLTKANTAGGLGIDLGVTAAGPNKPVISISWYDAAKFVNYLNTSTGHSPAYNFDGDGNFTLWSSEQAWQQGGENLYRNKDAHYFLPNNDEWYKAAYYDPNKVGGGGYWRYATGKDSPPTAVSGGTAPGTAVFAQGDWSEGHWEQPLPADINNAGGLSPYGTMAQEGNAQDLLETASDGVNDSAAEMRMMRGGNWLQDNSAFGSGAQPYEIDPGRGDQIDGFRVAAVPEPEEFATAFGVALLGAGVWLRRKTVQ